MDNKCHTERSSGNVFADLNVQEAEQRLIEARLAVSLACTLREQGWTPQEAAKRLQLSQIDIASTLRGRLSGCTAEELSSRLASLNEQGKGAL